MTLDPRHIAMLRCPATRLPLVAADDVLVVRETGRRYSVTKSGIPCLMPPNISDETRRQMEHYDDDLARRYRENLGYPHTKEYMAYLDRCVDTEVQSGDLEEVAELCCGQGEVLSIFGDRVRFGVGVDASLPMLERASASSEARLVYLYVQGDATLLPLADASVRSVFMLGGVHHVPDRKALFAEIFRVLRPGGRFFFREPASDFFLWRAIRAVIYRISPALDADTERPLRWSETVPPLEAAGLELVSWKTYGFLGFCLFMNSDVLVINRLFRFVPGIRAIVRLAAATDDFVTRLPGIKQAGLQVVGVARKPA